MEGPRASPRSGVQERRAEERTAHSLHIRYSTAGSNDISRGMLVDLNISGAGIQTEQPLPVGTRLILELTSPDGSTARCAAEILHSRRSENCFYCAGVKFIDLDEKDLAAIQDILQVDVPPGDQQFAPVMLPPREPLGNLSSGLERRRAARVGVNRSISYKIYGAYGRVQEEGVAQLFDLSLTGVGLRTSGPICQGISLQLEVVYSGGLRCAIEAECIYCRKDSEAVFTNGLRFTAIEKSDLAFFSKLLAG